MFSYIDNSVPGASYLKQIIVRLTNMPSKILKKKSLLLNVNSNLSKFVYRLKSFKINVLFVFKDWLSLSQCTSIQLDWKCSVQDTFRRNAVLTSWLNCDALRWCTETAFFFNPFLFSSNRQIMFDRTTVLNACLTCNRSLTSC